MIADEWPFPELCDAIKPHYLSAKKEATAFNAKSGPLKRGVGLAADSFGIGDPGQFGYDPKTGRADSFVSECHNIQLAEVEVDTHSGNVRVIKVTTAVDAGTIINPQNLEGQLEGGIDQGVGYALREEYVHGKTMDYVTFKFPTIMKSVDYEIVLRETPRSKGSLGATGIGEMTMVPTAPAVINAIKDACGVRIYGLPATPSKVTAALNTSRETDGRDSTET